MPRHKPPAKWVPLLVAGALLMENLDATVLNTVTRRIAIDFAISPLQLKFALTAYLVGLSVGIPLSGRLADRFGARPIFSLALVLFALGSLCCGLATNLVNLVVSRLIQGAGGALMVPVARLVLLRSYAKADLVRVTNLTALPALLGPMLGPVLGGAVATVWHWRAVFFLNVPLCALALWLAQSVLDDDEPRRPLGLDGWAYLPFAIALASMSFALECLGDPAISWRLQLTLWALAGSAALAFAVHTTRHGGLFLQLSLFRLRTFRLGVLGNLVSRLSVGSTPFLLPLMLQLRLHYTPLTAGLALMPLSAGMLTARSAVGRLLRRFGFRQLLVGNTVLFGASQMALALIGVRLPLLLRLAIVFAYGAFASVHFACMNVLAYVDIEEQDMAGATAMVSVVHTFAMGLGVAIGALVVDLFLRPNGGLPGGPAFAFHRTFALLGLATALSAFLFARLDEHDGAQVSGHA